MKKMMLFAGVILCALISQAKPTDKNLKIFIHDNSTAPIELDFLNLPEELNIYVSYPGQDENSICTIELKDSLGNTLALKRFLDSVTIQVLGFTKKSDDAKGSITFKTDGKYQLYVGRLRILSKSNTTLKELIFKNFTQRFNSLTVVPHLCNTTEQPSL